MRDAPPSLGATDARMANLRSSDNPMNRFDLSDMEELRVDTLKARCLSLQVTAASRRVNHAYYSH